MCYFKLHRAYSNSFSSSNVCKFFWSWILKRLYQSLEKEKESRCIVFTSSTKRKIRQFHVAVVLRRQRNVQKNVMHVQSCCFASLNLLSTFLPFSLPSPSSLLKLPNCREKGAGGRDKGPLFQTRLCRERLHQQCMHWILFLGNLIV